jgi:hypothetical protein
MDETTLHNLSTEDFCPAIVRRGACICWPANLLTVPIPLIDFRWLNERLFAWATIQTPFGREHPLFGLARYASQSRMEAMGAAFYDADGEKVCAIVANEEFGFPEHTVEKLRRKSAEHFARLEADPDYAHIWEDRFNTGIAKCYQNGQPK